MKHTWRVAWAVGPAVLGVALCFALASGRSGAPLGTIQTQINAAQNGVTINIAAGTYNESLTVNKSITLTGASSTTTIIQAVIGQRVITVTSGNNLVLQNLTLTGGQATGDVGGGVIIQNANLRVINSVIASNSADYGGGIFHEGIGHVEMIGSRIERNDASYDGGGLYLRGDLSMTDTQVLSNTASGHGGGLHADTGTVSISGGLWRGNQAGQNGGGINANNAVSIRGSRFISNTAGADGGALLQWNAGFPVSLTNAYFERNLAHHGGGLWARGNLTVTGGAWISNSAYINGAVASGGGIYLESGSLRLSGAAFISNTADCLGCKGSQGGGLYLASTLTSTLTTTIDDSLFESGFAWLGGGVSSDSPVTIRRTTFQNNSAGYGGGVDARNAAVQQSLFKNNRSVNGGGAVALSGSASSLDSSRMISNTSAYGCGGAVLITNCTGCKAVNNVVIDTASGASNQGIGVCISWYSKAALMSHNTIARNQGGDGSGVVVMEGSTAVMTNTIIANQVIGITATASSMVTVTGVLWYGNGTNTGGAGIMNLQNATAGAPAFAADGYHLTPGSAAIDHGIRSGLATDIDGDPRPIGPAYDLGADEFARKTFLPVLIR